MYKSRGISHQDSANSLIYILEEPNERAGGYIWVVRVEAEDPSRTTVVSYRRLSRKAAKREAEIARLLANSK